MQPAGPTRAALEKGHLAARPHLSPCLSGIGGEICGLLLLVLVRVFLLERNI